MYESVWWCMCVLYLVMLVVWWVSLSEVLSHQWVGLQPKQQGPEATSMHLILVKPQAMIYMMVLSWGASSSLLHLSFVEMSTQASFCFCWKEEEANLHKRIMFQVKFTGKLARST